MNSMSLTTNNALDILPEVIEIITRTGNLATLTPDEDFYQAGVTSIMALPILLEIEDRFHVTIPDDLFIAARSSRAIAEIVTKVRQA
jgi:acyl carrier protein